MVCKRFFLLEINSYLFKSRLKVTVYTFVRRTEILAGVSSTELK